MGSPKSTGLRAGSALAGRRPTSHERMAGQPWEASYCDGPAPWDIGRPQPAIVRLAERVCLAGPVLDAGCGTGEHALYLAAKGLAVAGIEVAETALKMARAKARARGLEVEFAAADALELAQLGRHFATVVDCGLFHSFDADERVRYVAGLAAVVEPGGAVYVLCFSDQGDEIGPHPVSEEELRRPFQATSAWRVVAIETERIETNIHAHGVSAWLATVRRI